MGWTLGLTRGQLLILLSLVAVLVLVSGVGLTYVYLVDLAPLPTAASTLPKPVTPGAIEIGGELPAAATALPTYEYRPTFTAMPSPTAFEWRPAPAPTAKPTRVPAQSNPAPAANPKPATSSSACAATLEYAAAVHQYNLDMIDYIHSPMIQYYEGLMWQLEVDRDALGLVQAQRGLDAERAEVKAEKASENKRYQAEKAHIQATCQ